MRSEPVAAYALIAHLDQRLAARLARALAEENLECIRTRDGGEASRIVEERGPPALLITDLTLAGTDGFRLLTSLRAKAAVEQSPAVVISAFACLREAAFAQREALGVAAIVSSTASAEVLRRALRRARSPLRTDPHAQEEIASVRVVERTPDASRMAELGLDPQGKAAPQLIALVEDVARRFGVAASFVSVVAGRDTFFRASSGLPAAMTAPEVGALDWTFCRLVAEARHPLIVPDAAHHPAFAHLPLVKQGQVGSYLGVPLITSEGIVLGAVGVLDSKPRTFGAERVDELAMVARRAAAEIELTSRPSPSISPPAPVEAYFRAALAHLPLGVLFIGPNHRLAFANSKASELLDIPLDELGRVNRAEVVTRLSRRGAEHDDLEALLRVPPEGPYVESAEFELATPKHQVLRWSTRPVPLGEETGQLVLIEDITTERTLLAEREHLARTDLLTGLGNRRNAEEAVAREVARARRQALPLSFIMFDIDHFKRVNDTHGHAAGDATLRALGEVFRRAFRGFDLANRWGGEEFLIVLPSADLHRARLVADRVRAQVEKMSLEVVGSITISGGVAELGAEETAEEAIGRADERLYEAKSAGRNRIA